MHISVVTFKTAEVKVSVMLFLYSTKTQNYKPHLVCQENKLCQAVTAIEGANHPFADLAQHLTDNSEPAIYGIFTFLGQFEDLQIDCCLLFRCLRPFLPASSNAKGDSFIRENRLRN